MREKIYDNKVMKCRMIRGVDEEDLNRFLEVYVPVIEADPQLEEYITTKGFSYDRPIFAEDGSVDMDVSRRVEFHFILNAE